MPARSPKKPSKPAKRSSPPAKAAKHAPARKAAARALPNAVKAARGPGSPAPQLPLRAVTPHLVIDGASDAIAWYAKALGAKELARVPLPNGRLMHAAIQVGDSILMLADSFGPAPPTMAGVTLHIQLPTIDKLWASAVANGGKVEMPLANQFWGDRYGQLRDPFGHLWSFGWPAQMTQAEKDRLQAEAMAMFAAGGQPGRDA